ncbi:hypothetical protein CAF53_24090 [Sphingobium sp. LB126]|nr:hypothetical protein CAF53_24090 [Sphingobium sp. LB126]
MDAVADDVAFIAGNADAGKLGLACQLAFWRSQGRFPDEEADLAPAVIAHLAGQIGVEADVESYAFTGRSGRRHRQLVLDHLAVGTFDHAAEAAFRSWLLSDMLPASRHCPRLRTRSPDGSPRGGLSGPDRTASTDWSARFAPATMMRCSPPSVIALTMEPARA